MPPALNFYSLNFVFNYADIEYDNVYSLSAELPDGSCNESVCEKPDPATCLFL